MMEIDMRQYWMKREDILFIVFLTVIDHGELKEGPYRVQYGLNRQSDETSFPDGVKSILNIAKNSNAVKMSLIEYGKGKREETVWEMG